MRHKYATEAIVLSRSPFGEASYLVTLLTRELGLVRARAQGIRKPGAKLSPALQTFIGSDVVMVRGKEGWRLSGAIRAHDYTEHMTPSMRERAGRTAHLMARLLQSDEPITDAYAILDELLRVLPELHEEDQDAVETLAALYILAAVGLDAGEAVPEPDGRYGDAARSYAKEHRADLIVRVNRGINASGL